MLCASFVATSLFIPWGGAALEWPSLVTAAFPSAVVIGEGGSGSSLCRQHLWSSRLWDIFSLLKGAFVVLAIGPMALTEKQP